MVRTSPRLQKDVDLTEEAELMRLEAGDPLDDMAAGGVDGDVQAGGGLVIVDDGEAATSTVSLEFGLNRG